MELFETEHAAPGRAARRSGQAAKRSHRGHGISLFIQISLLLHVLSLQEVLAQQQSFRRRPEDVEIKLGDTAILRCEIENQAGQAQWTKDGFALGFPRDIPNFPRYSMTGDADRGVHNLRIEHVTLSDIAEYQCQVGPARANKAIRADAKLNVIVPPVSVEIVNHAADATIILKERTQTELECVAREARPAATIVWYRNDIILRAESRTDSTEETEVVDGSVHVLKNTTRSKIKFFPTSEDDKAKYTCEARHPAFSRPQRVSVVLSVQYAPGAPRIDGYNEDTPIKENKTVTLTCVSRGGNPLAQLIWFKNNIMVDTSYDYFGKESRNEYTFVANKKDDMATLRCEASNMMSLTPKLADVVLSVYYPPKEVKMTGPNEAKINDTITLTCASSNSNPSVEIALFKGGVALNNVHTSTTASTDGGFITSSNVTVKIDKDDRKVMFTCQAVNRGYGDTKSIPHVVNVIQPPGQPYIYKGIANITAGQMHRITCTSTGGHPPATLTWYKNGKKADSVLTSDGNIVTAELSMEANMTDNGVPFKCEAKNKAITTPLSETVTFQVFFPATGMTIQSRPKKLKEGEKGYLTCESGSSNPPSRVTFWRNGQEVPSQSEPVVKKGEYGGKKTLITLELNLTASMDQAIFECEVKNAAIKRGKRDSIKLDVNYKPVFTDSGEAKVTVVEGEGKVISTGAKGNPNSIKYKWSKNGSLLKSVVKKLHIDGAVLNFTEVSRADKGKYECEATNSEGSTIQTIELEVQYPAAILTEEPWIMADQGEDAHLECGIDANPLDESMVEWMYEEMNITRQTKRAFQDNKAYLTIPNVSKSDAGSYLCIVDNGIGQPVNKSIFLIVKHKPDIDLSPQIAKAASNKGETGKLTCRARGAPNVTFSWSREGVSITPDSNPSKYAIQNRSVDLMTWESILEVKKVQTDDYGQYECIASNSIDFATHQVQLDVTSAPDTPLGLHVLNITQDSVTLTWIPGFDGGFEQGFIIKYINMKTNEKRTVETTPPNATIFTIHQLATGTEYSFRIMAVNALGESNYTTEIVRGSTQSDRDQQLSQMLSGRPDLPKLIIVSVSIIGTFLLLLNIVVVSFFLYKKSNTTKTKQDEASEQGSSKSATIEMYAPSSYNETVTGETLSSISEKSASYSHGENHCDEYIDDHGKGTGVSTYLVEQINHHAPGYPYGELGGLRASTLPRHPKHISPIDPHRHHEDDGYIDALRRNGYTQGYSDKIPNYGRTTPRPVSSRPPQVPPIPELYNIPPEARYVPYPPTSFGSPLSNGTVRQMPHSASHDMLNSTNQIIDHMSSFHQPNGRLITSNAPLSPHRGSILTTFVPNPSPNNIEHEGHLV